jgi:pilus assembly protein CpaC
MACINGFLSRVVLLCCLCWLIPTSAVLAQSATIAPAAAHPADAKVVNADQKTLRVDLDSGALVRLSEPAAAVFVANPEIADVQIKTPTLIYVFAKAAGETTLFAVDSRDQVLLSRTIVVNYSLTRLRESIQSLAPNAKIEVTAIDGGVILRGQVANASQADSIRELAAKFIGSNDAVMNQLEITGANQVNLRIRIAEISRDTLKNIGFNWDVLANPKSAGNVLFGLATGRVPFAAGAFASRAIDSETSLVSNSIVGRFDGSNYDLNGVVDLLENEGLISVLAEPNLTAVSGETANFLAGGEFPVPVSQQDNQISIEFKPYGVSLAFTPTILGDNRIAMRIRPEVSQLSSQGAIRLASISIPAITTRRAETTVEIGSGQSFALAGLIQHSSQEDTNKYPWLGDLPVIGTLFKSDRFRRRETELVIIATPYIVRPSSAKLASPTDNMRLPNDAERLLLNKNHVPMNAAGNAAPTGGAGFITE